MSANQRIQPFLGRRQNTGINYNGILDAYQTDCYRAYGLINFFSSYTGDCVVVNTSDNSDVSGTSTIIGFDSNGLVDEAQLLSVASGGSLYIESFYDLTGNGRHSHTHSSTGYKRRARIVNNGVVEKFNGFASPFHHVTSIAYSLSGIMFPAATTCTIIYAHDLVNTSQFHVKLGAGSNSATGFSFVAHDGSTSTLINGSAFSGNTLRANKSGFSGTNRNNVFDFLSGKKIVSEYGFSSVGAGFLWPNYGATGSAGLLNGSMPCMLMWSANLGTTAIDQIMDILNEIYTVY